MIPRICSCKKILLMPPDLDEIDHITENMVAMNKDLLKPLVHAYGQAEVVATVPVLTPLVAQLFTAVFRKSYAVVVYPDLADYHPRPDFEIRYLNKKASKARKNTPAAGAEAVFALSRTLVCSAGDDFDAECLSSNAVEGALPSMDAYSRHVHLTKSLIAKAAAELKVGMDEPLTRAMQKTLSDAAKKQWAKTSDEEAAVPAAKSRGQGSGRGNGRGKGGRGKGGRGNGGRGKGGRGKGGPGKAGRGKGKGRGRGKGGGKGLAAKLRRSLSTKLSEDCSSTKAKAAPKKASAKKKAKRNLAEAEVPASMEHPVDRLNAQLQAFEDDKGQEFDASKKTWGRVSDELKSQGYGGIQCLYLGGHHCMSRSIQIFNSCVRLLQSHPEWNAVHPNFRREYEKLLHQWD
ncbi:unnamed protein product [Symbiodinium sp. CCMP2592]|nr:unnamed protein product [Symbiodinium sp. CCMP2592]